MGTLGSMLGVLWVLTLRSKVPGSPRLFLQWFRSAVVKEDAMPADLMTLLFSNIDPIYEFHRGFLRAVEQRLALW